MDYKVTYDIVDYKVTYDIVDYKITYYILNYKIYPENIYKRQNGILEFLLSFNSAILC